MHIDGHSIPGRYVPNTLTRKDQQKQLRMLKNSRNLYTKGKYLTRKKVKSFVSLPSLHVRRAQRIYGVPIRPTRALVKASGCPLSVLQGIVKKGESGQSVNESSSPSSPIAPPSPLLLSSGGQQDEPEFMALHDGIESAFISIILTHINEVIRTRSGNK